MTTLQQLGVCRRVCLGNMPLKTSSEMYPMPVTSNRCSTPVGKIQPGAGSMLAAPPRARGYDSKRPQVVALTNIRAYSRKGRCLRRSAVSYHHMCNLAATSIRRCQSCRRSMRHAVTAQVTNSDNESHNSTKTSGSDQDAIDEFRELFAAATEAAEAEVREEAATGNDPEAVLAAAAKAEEIADSVDPLLKAATMADLMATTGNLEAAARQHEEVRLARVKLLGERHPDTLGSALVVADLLYELEDYRGAFDRFSEVYDIRAEMMGPEHPQTLEVQSDLADLAALLKEWMQAEEIHREVLTIRQRVLGPDHEDTLCNLSGLSTALAELNRTDEAIHVSTLAHASLVKVLGPFHHNTLTAKANTACIIARAGRFQEAVSQLTVTTEECAEHLGTDHQLTMRCLNNLAGVMAEADALGVAITSDTPSA